MRSWTAMGATVAPVVLGVVVASRPLQTPAVRSVGRRFFGIRRRVSLEPNAYPLRILPKANHLPLEAKLGSNAEMASLQQFVTVYFTTIQDWLAKRIRGFGPRR
jgi:hypothetical protein